MTTAAEPNYILSAGLGRFASQDANAAKHFGPQASEKTRELLAISIAQARDAGFEVIGEDVNPGDPDDTIKRFSAQLESRQWVAVNVGYGIRGNKDHTVLFERILEACRTTRPEAKIIFSNGPDEVFTAIKRNFPESCR
ncbi:hypothetical protein LTR91_020970 [Friedmanniomyces endolithicus]|uniref:Uncharacterized protein n=1 Tax=Friedmanniomyces endolithicus TaxID=329885 RepID=A0A4U0U9K4_9PEZI|nr:hypothetical protein LTS09_003424 [Friedmanniomyces endolithicus]KAK0343653.1 hypothetical protein LTR94_017599 [Friedmanniomyces endolithicus]KAK0774278.1 hypothetical protein LTR59_014965 [Friedmanniomyces endolithicus]KAK0778475.1 hypothetical protein LTR38_014769 [Friedmanniomyces endolithicus]KAK0781830.1 hypothetical protein LTR75_014571 [Friedmanniomyces endolithicus]